MIGNSLTEYYFIRVCIAFLHHVTPVSVLIFTISLFLHSAGLLNPLPVPLQLWSFAETVFYFCFYLPLRSYYQRAANHPPLLPRDKREELFRRCLYTVNDGERYLRMWFKGAPISEIRHDNVKEFLAWGFLGKSTWSTVEDEELEQYVKEMEKDLLGRELLPGRGSAKSLRLTVDKFEPLHRSILWYFCVAVVDTIAFTRLSFSGFHFHRLPLSRSLTVFPPRPLAPLSRHVSPSNTLTYWHREHRSTNRIPVVFIHGIGIGLYPYTKFLNELNSGIDSDGDVGIIVVEIMSISFRLTTPPLTSQEFCRDMRLILAKHGWDKFVLASHSYGSVLSSQMLHDPKLLPMIGPILLIDPVCFLLNIPDVASNFTVRQPQTAAEYQLWYFGSKDISVAWTLARHFFWTELILWKEDLRNHSVTVSLAGRDLIVDTRIVRDYLSSPGNTTESTKVLWFDQLDHAQVFDKRQTRKVLLDVLRTYCSSNSLSAVSEKNTKRP